MPGGDIIFHQFLYLLVTLSRDGGGGDEEEEEIFSTSTFHLQATASGKTISLEKRLSVRERSAKLGDSCLECSS